MAKILVPKTPAKAFNPNRRPSDLIQKQIQHLEWALLPAAQRGPRRLRGRTVKTEAQAGAYIALLTARVQEAYDKSQAAAQAGAAPDAGPLKPVRLPPLPKLAQQPRKTKKTTTARPAARPQPRARRQR
jgi:hypothetical protein